MVCFMEKFMGENFLLNSETAINLYDDFARDIPIIDYHCDLSQKLLGGIVQGISCNNAKQYFNFQ